MKYFLLATCWIISFRIFGEDIEPHGQFLSDSVKIGQPVKYSLSVYHLSETQVLFPDTLFNFAPFELVLKEYFPTVSLHGRSFDSAVYTLRTFQLPLIQTLSLPVYTVTEGDSAAFFSAADSVFVKQYHPETPISLDLREQTDLAPVKQKFNYPYLVVYSIIFLVTVSVLYFMFGKAINRRYRMFKVRSDHMSFEKNYKKLQEQFNQQKGSESLEKALSIWKAYLARLENKPINTYTSTEIIDLYNKEELKNGLNVIDRAIYGGVISTEAEKALITLKRFSIRMYHRRKKEIQDV